MKKVRITLDKVVRTFHFKGIPYEIVERGQYVKARYVDHHELINNRCVEVYKTDIFGREQEVEQWFGDY